MLQSEVLEALARSQGAKLAMNERESWFKRQTEMRSESLANGCAVSFVRFGGEDITIQIHKTADGNTVEIVRDVSRETELQERALRAEREAIAADRIKAVTLSRLSHTIRTPMTGVLTAAELMLDGEMDELQRSRLDIIKRSAGTLLGVVQDMFDIAEQTNGSPNPEEAPITSRRAIIFAKDGEIVDHIKSDLAGEGFEVAIGESAMLVSQAAWQLANSERPVELIVVTGEEQRKEIAGVLSRRAMYELPQLQVRSGTVHASDQSSLPVPPEPHANIGGIQELSARHSAGACDILVVEDDDVSQIVFSQALSTTEYSFSVVGKGSEAVEQARVSRPRLVLMDVSMPDMNGVEATRRIRDLAGDESVQPIIIGMTNHFLAGDRKKCLAAGMDEYVLKPSSADAIALRFNEWLSVPRVRKAG